MSNPALLTHQHHIFSYAGVKAVHFRLYWSSVPQGQGKTTWGQFSTRGRWALMPPP